MSNAVERLYSLFWEEGNRLQWVGPLSLEGAFRLWLKVMQTPGCSVPKMQRAIEGQCAVWASWPKDVSPFVSLEGGV